MNQTVAVQPDLEFKRTVLGLDAGDLGACYQCGTCSVVCPISTDDDPFPRKPVPLFPRHHHGARGTQGCAAS